METKIAEKDDLNLDKTSNVVGIDPRLLAAADEEFLIYSPTKSSYVFMSKDPSLAAMMHTKLEVKSNRDSQRNFFKLIKIHEEDAFYLKNTKTEKFVYISGEHVLGMTGDPSEHEDKSKFVFQFEAIDGNACYKIKNGKHYLFVSKTTSGIPPNHVIHTSTEADNEANIFQFVLEKNAKEVKIEFDLKEAKKTSNPLDELLFEFKNEGSEDKIEEPSVKKEYTKNETFAFTGLSYNGNYKGGHPAKNVDEFFIMSTFTERSTDPEASLDKVDESFKITVPPGRITTLKYEVTQYQLQVPFTVELTTANKKTITATGIWTQKNGLFTKSLVSNK